MVNNVSRNKISRAAHINSFRKIVDTTLEQIYKDYRPDKLFDLNSSLTLLQNKFDKISNIHEKIVNEIEEENLEAEISKQTDFEEYACKQISICKSFLEKCTTDEASSVTFVASTSKHSSKNVKLPRIELKKFNGDPLQWKTFIDTFKSAIHENSTLTEVEKMNYLKSLLTGPAEETINGISLSNDNYKVVLDLLEKRFGDEQVILSAHMNNLLSLECVRGVSDVKGLRTLCDRIEGQVRCLEALGIKARNYGPLLIPVIMTKIPNEIKLIISRKFGHELWDTEAILEFLNNELQARERINHATLSNFDDSHEKPKTTSFSLVANSSSEKTFQCIFCKREHKSQDCQIVKDISTRKSIIQREQRCFLCLKKGHQSRNCPAASKIRFTCCEKHHVAICLP